MEAAARQFAGLSERIFQIPQVLPMKEKHRRLAVFCFMVAGEGFVAFLPLTKM